MSTGYECLIVEAKPKQWYYILQDWDCPVGAWNWMEHATTYGSFSSEEAAYQHLRDNHANPGGYCTDEYRKEMDEDKVLQKCVEGAVKPRAQNSFF